MSWSKSIALTAPLIALILPLTGCGFEPLYDRDGSVTGLQAVQVLQVNDRTGQILTNRLRDDFSGGALGVPAVYSLEISLTETKYDAAIRTDSTASRSALQLSANYRLRRISDNKSLLTGVANEQTGHDVTDSGYANVIGSNSDETRALSSVCEQIERRIALFLRDQNNPS